MSTTDTEKIFAELDELAHGGGFADDATLRRFKHLVGRLRILPNANPYVREKLSAAESYAAILYKRAKAPTL